MLHTFVAYVEDKPGVLTRVASLFRRLNINIISLTVGRSERVGLSRLTLVCEASAEAGHRIRASLYKLENVVDVDDIAGAPAVTRELVLIKVAATRHTRSRSHVGVTDRCPQLTTRDDSLWGSGAGWGECRDAGCPRRRERSGAR